MEPWKDNWKKGWKVITKGGRRSCTHFGRAEKSICTYLKNKVVHRPFRCGPLAVFKTRECARAFIHGWMSDYTTQVVKCLYVESSCESLWERVLYLRFGRPAEELNRMGSMSFPDGTILADKVKCLE